LESMTRQFDVSIIVDETTAEFVRQHLPESVATVRKLARVRPKGMEAPVAAYELVAGVTRSVPDHSQFESAVDHIVSGNWIKARELLGLLPDDGPKRFLIQQMCEHDFNPPDSWDGAFQMTRK